MPHVGGRRCIMDWHHPTLERLVEIGSAWGQFPWLYRDVMARGYKLGASANGDEHRGRCGGGVPGTAVFGVKGGVTGILSDKLSRKAIGKALRERHTWATTGERSVALAVLRQIRQGDEFEHEGSAEVSYRFLGDVGWDEIAAYDHAGLLWRRDLHSEYGFSERRIRLRWGGARIKDRYRWAAWKGSYQCHQRRGPWFPRPGLRARRGNLLAPGSGDGSLQVRHLRRFRRNRVGLSNLANARIRVEGTIDGYVKVGDPLKGNPFVHCPTFSWEISGKELLASQDGALRMELGGQDMFLALERLSDVEMPRDVSGTLDVAPQNGPHGFRPVYLAGRQSDGSMAWTSALFITFK